MTDTWLGFLLMTLAAWRLAYMLVEEDGPGAIFARLRRRAGLEAIVQMGPDGQPIKGRVARGWLAELLSCVWCTSVWTAGVLVGWGSVDWGPVHWVWEMVRAVLAVSAAAIIVHEVVKWTRMGGSERG